MYLIINYAELSVKGKNKRTFENKLLDNLKKVLSKDFSNYYKRYGKIIFKLNNDYNKKRIIEILKKTPGISNFKFSKKTELDLEKIKTTVFDFVKDISFKSFKIETKRSNKSFKYKSPELNKLLGEQIYTELNKKVDLKNPEIKVYVDIGEKECFVSLEKYLSVGGLPVGTSSKIACSLSGGIDSPVSSYLMMKRGCEIVFFHIYNSSLVKDQVFEKITDLVKKLTKYQLKSKLIIIPFSEIQSKIIENVHENYRMIVYRRFMFKLINELARKYNCKAIITGDSLGQVASQTIENISSIYESSKMPILTPLISYNKQDIINISKFIQTYDISIKQYPDCCSFMTSKHPETKSDISEIKLEEQKIDNQKKLIENAIKRSDEFVFNYL